MAELHCYPSLELLLSQLEVSTGVGEVGLDGSPRYAQHFELQKHIFTSIIERSAALGGRVLSVHSRAAAREVLDVLEDNPGFGVAVLHWFTDSVPLLKRAILLGCWFSVGPVMLSSANGRKLAAMMPRDRVVTESDGPFAKVRGLPVMPWEAASANVKLAAAWDVSPEDAAYRLAENGRTLAGWLRR